MKRFSLILMFVACSVCLMAQEKAPISLKVQGEYGYNYSYKHYGTLSAIGYFPINSYFDLSAGLQASTANVYALDGRAIVNFPLKVGALHLENRWLYRDVACYKTHELTAALSLGYSMDYFRVAIGWCGRMYGESWRANGASSFVTEPLNLIWNIEAHARPDSCNWNLGVRISNNDDFQIERFNEFIFTLMGRYDVNEHWRVFADVACKPSGVFHITANFFGVNSHFGFIYRW